MKNSKVHVETICYNNSDIPQERLFKKTARELSSQNIPYMVIEGQAVLLYGESRLTKDIDITLGNSHFLSIDNYLIFCIVKETLG